LDARQAHPLWAVGTVGWLHARVTGKHDASVAKTFSAWRIPGRKRIAHAGTELVLVAMHGSHCLRASLSSELEDGAAYSLLVPLDPSPHARLPEYQVQARVFGGEVPQPKPRPVGRAALLHLRALQALDAWQTGAHHRDIAGALFGADAVRTRWTADSELRAQVRHLLNRAEGLMRGGYLALAGVRQPHIRGPGDEPAY
jgi:hypothetical protein